jgi:hypothetical protein
MYMLKPGNFYLAGRMGYSAYFDGTPDRGAEKAINSTSK